ncbi:hypothetical protein J6590_021413 [Homalodisca vitripennis]|nr:hypothetical protein J6590_036868 [Homalodisca vitripennis]KAG8268596.1 hypothetical protein J6590_021413 [Homalodisca vitripennis]
MLAVEESATYWKTVKASPPGSSHRWQGSRVVQTGSQRTPHIGHHPDDSWARRLIGEGQCVTLTPPGYPLAGRSSQGCVPPPPGIALCKTGQQPDCPVLHGHFEKFGFFG